MTRTQLEKLASKFTPGARVAYAARHLKNTGQQTGPAGARRGTFVKVDAMGLPWVRVNWDDTPARLASGQGNFAETDYCADVRAHGELANITALAVVGSARFACNDI